jgi:hypothetical protein
MPAGFGAYPVHPGAVGIITVYTVGKHVILDRLIGPVIPVETEVIKAFKLIFQVQMLVILPFPVVDPEFAHMKRPLFLLGKTIIPFHPAAKGVFVTAGQGVAHERYQIESKLHGFIKMDTVHPVIIGKIIQTIDLLGPMPAFNEQNMIFIRTAYSFNGFTVKFV